MTPERKAQLESVMDAVITREIKFSIGTHTPEQTAQHITDLAQIAVCINTAYDLLSGDAYRKLGDALISVGTRSPKPDPVLVQEFGPKVAQAMEKAAGACAQLVKDIDQEKDGRDAARELHEAARDPGRVLEGDEV